MQSSSRSSTIIDVCKSDYVKSVKCDVPISEGFGPENLISTDSFVRSKGFLAERFIKPPVCLTFDLKCKIDLKYVVIDCCVGAQKTSGIELFTQQPSNHGSYESIASGVLPDNKRGFVFHRYDVNISETFGEHFLRRTFKYRSSEHLSSVLSVRIKIFRSGRTCVPAVGKLNLFGIPAVVKHSFKPSATRHDTRSLRKPSIDHKGWPVFGGIGPLSTQLSHTIEQELSSDRPKLPVRPLYLESKRGSAQLDNCNTTIIPEDFLDPITCEIMTQPVILPSGKVVDFSTLEKYEKTESIWGRGLSDPFTGLAFNDTNKPIAASDLKARIDKFLTDNSNSTELKSIPRTLGTSKASSHTTVQLRRSDPTCVRVSKLVSVPPTTSRSVNVQPPSTSCSVSVQPSSNSRSLNIQPPSTFRSVNIQPPSSSRSVSVQPPSTSRTLNIQPPSTSRSVSVQPPSTSCSLNIQPPSTSRSASVGLQPSSPSCSPTNNSKKREIIHKVNCDEKKPKRRKKIVLEHSNLKFKPTCINLDEKKRSLPLTYKNGEIELFPATPCPRKAKSKELFCKNMMDESLDAALKSTLSKLPNLTADKDSENEESSESSCQVCTSQDNLFSAPCTHLICRPCLINKRPNKTITCSKCNCVFKPDEVQKVHLSKT